MLKRPFDKSKLPSRHVTEGPERAPHRSYYYAMGMTEEEIHQPLVGVATCWNEAAPCNIALSRQAQAVKMGVKQGYGTPREFTTITVTDGIAMGHEGMRSSLASREAIADTVELTMRGHCYDALVGLAGCDKSLPGHDDGDGAAQRAVGVHLRRLDPAGPAPQVDEIPEDFRTRDLTVQDMFEAVGRHQNGQCPTPRWTCSNASPARRPGPAAASSPRTPWPACPRRSAWRCSTLRGMPAPYEAATSTARRRAAR